MPAADKPSPPRKNARARAAGVGPRLVIVESPAKAKTIAGYLGSDYIVEASIGHIRDLPRNAADVPVKYKGEAWARLGVDVDHGFEPLYVVSPDRKQQVAKLKEALKTASEVYLATDEDREGEAIAWHLVETLKPTVPVRRMVFHEITRSAIEAAAANPRELDTDLVDAQETRRILDRLYGYEVSPVLWKEVMPKLSAGRVQSVATRIVVQREKARMAFHAATYADIEGTFTVTELADGAPQDDPRSFNANLIALGGDRIATGKDFDAATGKAASGVIHLDEAGASGLAARLDGVPFAVTRVEEKPYRRRPYAPFMTSTLQQEAGRKLRWSAAQVMRIAQRLYENGYITYMRTDSTNLSETAINAARTQVRELYGDRYVPAEPRRYAKKVKNAQEAHEAIRPSGDAFQTPGALASRLEKDEFQLYELIWKRTIASQMTDAVGRSLSVPYGCPVRRPPVRWPTSPPRARPSPIPGSSVRTWSLGTRARPTRRVRRRRAAAANADQGRPAGREPPERPLAHHPAAGPLHRGQPGEGDGRAGHRPAVDVRVDHADHPGPRLCVEKGRRADPVLHCLRGEPAARAAFRAARRLWLHGQCRGGSGQDRVRRPAPSGLADPVLLRCRGRYRRWRGAGRRAAEDGRREPRRDRRPRGQLHPALQGRAGPGRRRRPVGRSTARTSRPAATRATGCHCPRTSCRTS